MALDGSRTSSPCPTVSPAPPGSRQEAQLRDVANAGFEVVVNLGLLDPRYCLADEAGSVSGLGLGYHHIPVDFNAPQPDDLRRFFDAMDAAQDRKVFVTVPPTTGSRACRALRRGQARLSRRAGRRAHPADLGTERDVDALHHRARQRWQPADDRSTPRSSACACSPDPRGYPADTRRRA
jgi:protein tyrosine phosphatase (PTP) superfamily phosphohydrolase (DUF442 family)